MAKITLRSNQRVYLAGRAQLFIDAKFSGTKHLKG
jgi:hypothetical protein